MRWLKEIAKSSLEVYYNKTPIDDVVERYREEIETLTYKQFAKTGRIYYQKANNIIIVSFAWIAKAERGKGHYKKALDELERDYKCPVYYEPSSFIIAKFAKQKAAPRALNIQTLDNNYIFVFRHGSLYPVNLLPCPPALPKGNLKDLVSAFSFLVGLDIAETIILLNCYMRGIPYFFSPKSEVV